jgi:hypothetical protein
MTTTSPDAPLTLLARKVLTYLATLDEPVVVNEVTRRHRSPEAAEEAVLSLITGELANYLHDSKSVVVTDTGRSRAERVRAYNPQQGIHCKACVRVACVCVVRLECLGDGPHSLGCHGSHE